MEDTNAKRGRGRPRAFSREDALDAAMRLFWQKGYAATGIAELTEAMGIGTKSLYAAFGSKEGLYEQALELYITRYEDRVWLRFSLATTAREAVEAFLTDSASFLTNPLGDSDGYGCMVTLARAGDEGNDYLGTLERSVRGRLLERVRNRLADAKGTGELPKNADVNAMARLILSMQNGMSILARDGANRDELERAVKVWMSGWAEFARGS